WFFDLDLAEPQHFNHAVLLEAPASLAPGLAASLFAVLWARHDALRLRFATSPDGFHQTAEDAATSPLPFTVIELGALPPARRRSALEAAAASLQTSLDLAFGPLLRTALFGMGAGETGRLLLIAHHLTVDGVSWRILLDEIQGTYARLAAGES